MDASVDALSIVVVGASGDLARRKIFPALFALYCQGHLPETLNVFGFARTGLSHSEFRSRVTEHLTCRYVPGESCADRMEEFLARCWYVPGQYGSRDAFLDLYQVLRDIEGGRPANRMFYLAIPPSVFLDVARAIGDAGLVNCSARGPWSRVVIEKPFGRDRESSDRLTRELAGVFSEDQTFRIDHYLGKEVIQNLMVLRFANVVFQPLWHRDYIRSVQIAWQEELDVQGRGGYFDQYGIIRDVMQNHLLQILSLMPWQPPSSLDAKDVRDAKVQALRCVPPPEPEDVVVGQYTGVEQGGRRLPGYLDDETVSNTSRTPTFAALVLRLQNERWDGVPFLVRAGKALDAGMTEIRVAFREIPDNVFCRSGSCPAPNELVIRVQPDEAIYFTITSKVPGLGVRLATRNLDLRYEAAFSEEIPDAYESLLLDVLKGEKGLFIRSDELAAAWDIFTPLLHALDEGAAAPEAYERGSGGPAGAVRLAARHGVPLR